MASDQVVVPITDGMAPGHGASVAVPGEAAELPPGGEAAAASPSPASHPAVPPEYLASLYPTKTALPAEFAELIRGLETELQMPVWLLVQNGDDPEYASINDTICDLFTAAKDEIEEGKPVALLLHSPGGQADEAYKIARLFQRRSPHFVTVVPCYAKSASTLMAMGGVEILMGREAELGPLDVQLYDHENYGYDSALNAVQSLERLNAYSMQALDQVMMLLLQRTKRKPETILPMALQYATDMIKPLLEKIDTIGLTRKSRELKVAEDYSIRLMRVNYPHQIAKRIANDLVEHYSTHGFVIDREEAKAKSSDNVGLGLKIAEPKAEVERIFDDLRPFLHKLTVIGRVKEKKS